MNFARRSPFAIIRTLAVLVLVSLITGWVAKEALTTIEVDLSTLQARRDVRAWMADEPGTESPAWEAARKSLVAAVHLAPDSAWLYDYLGALYMARGLASWRVVEKRRQWLEQAVIYQETAVRLLPENALGWAELAVSRRLLQQSARLVVEDWNQALTQGPYELDVQSRLVSLALSNWPEATTKMKAWVLERYRSASLADRAELKEAAANFDVDLDDKDRRTPHR